MIALFALLAGCTPSGIYMITVPYTDGATECDSSLEENFTDGYSPDPDDGGESGPWTYESEYVGADQVLFFHLAPTSNGGAVLLWGDAAYPGTNESGTWVFDWSEKTSSDETEEHEDGYKFTRHDEAESTVTIELTIPLFGDLTGSISGSGSSVTTWTESDEWDQDDTDFSTGQIPSSSYLVYKEEGERYPQLNDWEEDDCGGNTCNLSISYNCGSAGAAAFTATRVEGNDVLEYGYIEDDGQSGSSGGGGIDTGF